MPIVYFTSIVLSFDSYDREMSAYENVVGGKLKLKGKALDVKAGGVKKKKKNKRTHQDQVLQVTEHDEIPAGGSTEQAKDATDEEDIINDGSKLSGEGKTPHYDDHLTPAERRYIEQREKLDVNRLAKISNKSHRDRIQDFNQYLANMSEHYDIPKVGPG
ncbi:hypothetical protein TanjilG_24459 [Lupinus angustifolius]|uniref:Protein FAM32A-like n=2 Tax=Lupinus angustifolius TaxID=3871 RepID=A0A1J7HWV6_LUPAN|nr:hypothetical protein TanjilG_24459 [Lupinus angustifolius]